MSLLIAFIVGVVIAIISSIPAGPITVAIVQATLNSGRRAGIMTGLGAIIVEAFYCSIAIFGFAELFKDPKVMKAMHLISIPILIILGIITLLKKDSKEDSDKVNNIRAHSFMILGATLCLINPFILLWWTTIVAYIHNEGWTGNSFSEGMSLLLGIAVGVALFFLAVIQFTNRTHRNIPTHILRKVNWGMGILFIGFGLYLGLKYMMGPAY